MIENALIYFNKRTNNIYLECNYSQNVRNKQCLRFDLICNQAEKGRGK